MSEAQLQETPPQRNPAISTTTADTVVSRSEKLA
jgi:hypothetical protein